MANLEPTAEAVPPPVHDDYGVSDGEWLRIDWKQHLHSVEVDSALGPCEVNYVEIGEGPALLFIHGLAGSWRNWLENMPALSRTHRVVALDLPGFGTSPMPSQPLSIMGYGDLIVKFADRLGLDSRTALIGHSMGGFIATEAVIEAPKRFSCLTLVSAAGISAARLPKNRIPDRLPETRKELTRAAMRTFLPIAEDRLERNLGRKRLRAASFSGAIAHPSMVGKEILWELGSYGMRSPGTLQAAYAMSGHDTRHRLQEIKLPTLLIWGQRDRIVPVGAAYSYQKRIAQSELQLIDDTGHMPQLERPLRFNRILEDFVSAIS